MKDGLLLSKIWTLSLFPEIFSTLNYGVIGRALKRGPIQLDHLNLRTFSSDRGGRVDDRPFGGGKGMVLKCEPICRALDFVKAIKPSAKVVYLSPQGRKLDQNLLKELLRMPALVLLCGRYEGIDERVLNWVDLEISIGDYVLSGGELPACVLIDALMRFSPETISEEARNNDSFAESLLEHPHFTRPQEFAKIKVPAVLLSGNHKLIVRYRLKQSLGRTWLRRPDLVESCSLNSLEAELLKEFIGEYRDSGKRLSDECNYSGS